MTTVKPLLSGEILVPKSGMWPSFKEVKLDSSRVFKGERYWWIEMTNVSGGVHLDTLSEKTLREGWVRKPSFYRVGKTYRFKSGLRLDRWYVTDLYQVDEPIPGDSTKFAVARMTDVNGRQRIATLTETDFGRMEEA